MKNVDIIKYRITCGKTSRSGSHFLLFAVIFVDLEKALLRKLREIPDAESKVTSKLLLLSFI